MAGFFIGRFMAATLFTIPKPFIFQATAVASGAKANFYITGTTTRQDTFTDKALTIAHDNPVVADAFGVFPTIYLDDTLNYKVDITDSLDNSLTGYPVDDLASNATLVVDLASTANAKGASLIGIEDAAVNFLATDVEAALAEIYSDLASTANALGASLVGVEDVASNFTATTLEAVLPELLQKLEDLAGIHKVKTADETRTDTAAIADDADLVFTSLAAATIYKIEGWIIVTCASATPDIKWKFNRTQLPQSQGYAFYEIDEIAGLLADVEPLWDTQRNTPLDGTNDKIIKFEGMIHTHATLTTDFKFGWAQNTSDATAVTIKLGSWMTATKLGTV